MDTRRSDDGSDSGQAVLSGSDCLLPVKPLEHYVTAVVGFAITLVTAAMVYPWLAATSESLVYLSSTVLVFTLAALWLGVWFVLEVLWEWRSGRLTGA